MSKTIVSKDFKEKSILVSREFNAPLETVWKAFTERESLEKWWAICDVLTNEFYGAIGLNDLKVEHKKAELGFWLLKEHCGKGYISEVLPEICRFGFEKRKLHRIEAIVEQENTNSKKCLIKNNFLLEGTMKECEIKNGRFISLEIYAKLNV